MNLATVATSSIGKKFIAAFTGLVMVVFTIGHLTGNLLLLMGPKFFNDYALFLEHLFHGWAVLLADLVLLVVVVSHIWAGVNVQLRRGEARPRDYESKQDAGGASQKSFASSTMIFTGVALLVFIVVHLLNFKWGATQTIPLEHGEHMRNLYGLVVTKFGQPLFAFGYIAMMMLFGVHISHGIWSACQSLGLANDKYLPILQKLGWGLSFLLAFGFIILPGLIFGFNSYFVEANQTYLQTMMGRG
ncbi:MAG: succinate dehydrogenase cytochrome b subunit [Candidatus Eremiobacteraeota bacterium]|nr:succinate dehydrogenase cytochrome b subunit [Candidatus Eremiobacteraeota bacterium]